MIFFTDKTMTVINNGSTEFVDLETEFGKVCLDLYNKGRSDEIPNLIAVNKLLDDRVQESKENGNLLVDGVEMDVELANKVREFKREGRPFDYLVKLAEKIQDIDSYFVRHQLYGFLQHNGHPITKDGNFIAYKMVSKEFKDLHTNTFDNSVGSVVSMNRRDCNEDPNQPCSAGLHVAAYDYAHKFGSGELVLCEVDPKDVVAVPKDYDQKKMRTCRYKVVGLADKPIEEATYENEVGNPWEIEKGDEISYRGEGFVVEEVEIVDRGFFDIILVDLRSLETNTLAYTGLDITDEHFTFR